jgi:hypothetical protein
MTVAPAATSATPSARWGVTKTAQRPLTPSLAGSTRWRPRPTQAGAEAVRRVFLRLLGNTPSGYRGRFADREAAP